MCQWPMVTVVAALHNICSISFSCLCGPNTQGDNFLQQTLFTWNFILCFNSSHFWPGFLIFCPDYAISSPECPLIFNRTICKWPSKKKDFWSTNNVAFLVQNDQQALQINFISFYKMIFDMVALFQQSWTSYFVDFWKLFVLKLFFMKLWWQEIFGIKCTCRIKIDINFQK